MSKKLWPFLLLFCLSACDTSTRHVEDVSDIESTALQVKALRIEPATQEIAQHPQFRFVKQVIRQQMESEIIKMPNTGRPVGVIITMDKLALYIDPTLTMVLGDNYSVEGEVRIVDLATNQILRTKHLYGAGSGRGGLLGLAINEMYDEEEKIKATLSNFSDRALYFVYPERTWFGF